MSNEEIAKEILICILQQDKIQPTSGNGQEEYNKTYIEEVCKAYNTVYQTVCNASKSKHEND